MDRHWLANLHRDLCAMSVELSREVLAMDGTNPDYERLYMLANRVDDARNWASSLLKMVDKRPAS